MCVGDDVDITCGYSSNPVVPVWVIGGETYTRREILENSAFDFPLMNKSEDTLLTVYSVSVSNNKTTFQCEFTLTEGDVYSSIGTLTVMGKLCAHVS